jgi:hypothetical protein
MKTYLCAVSPSAPENYHLGVQSNTWGVTEQYRARIEQTKPGDLLVFISSRAIRSIHRIESKVYEDKGLIWPPRDGDPYVLRIKISDPLYVGEIPSEEFSRKISFMTEVQQWGGTIQGLNGVFNNRLSDTDVAYLQSRLRKVEPKVVQVAEATTKKTPHTADGAKALFRFFEKDVLSALNRLLPSLGLRRYNGKDFPGEYDLGYGGNVVLCIDNQTGDLVVVDFNRGEAPNETLLRLLHYMSWVRQHLAEKKDVRGVVLAESAESALSAIVKEVPNVSIKCYRLGIELLDGKSA